MRRPRIVLVLLALAALVLWRRAGSGERVDIVYDDGSLFRFDRGLEARDLLDDARSLLTLLA